MAASKLNAVITLAHKLKDHLRDRSEVSLELVQQTQLHIKQTFAALNAASVAAKAQELDSLGTDIWNASAGILQENVVSRDPRINTAHLPPPGVLVRLLAFLLLDVSHHATPRHSKDHDQRLRILKVGLRAGRLCLDREQLELAMIVLQKCTTLIQPTKQSEDLVQLCHMPTMALDQRERSLNDLTYEYYLLRIMHAWRSNRLDLAEHFYQNLSKGYVTLSSASATLQVKAADLYYELSKSLAKTKAHKEALQWSERAFNALDMDHEQEYSQEAVELKLSIGASLVEKLLDSGEAAAPNQAERVVKQLEDTQSLSNRVVLPMLRFRLLAVSSQSESDQMLQTLLHIVRVAVLTEENFKLVLQTVARSERVQPEAALAALKSFICQRLLPEVSGQHDRTENLQMWLEKSAVTLIMLATRNLTLPSVQAAVDLRETFDHIRASASLQFSTKATHAAQTLLWQVTNSPGDAAAQQCYQLLRHPLFCNAGTINKGRIGRRLMRMSLENQDLQTAREIFFEMPVSAQNEPSTRYLAFKLALSSKDRDLAISSLRTIVKSADKDPTFLYACVLDAQTQAGMKDMAVASLRAIVEQRPAGVQLGSLLRCTAKLLLAETEDSAREAETVAIEVLATFEMAASNMNDLRKATTAQWTAEVQWWSKNAYNLAIKYCTQMSPDTLVGLLDISFKFMTLYPSELADSQKKDLIRRKSMCLFLSTCALISQGRNAEDLVQDQQGYYGQAQQKIQLFKTLHASNHASDISEDMKARNFAMHKFELECIMRLEEWSSLESVLQLCLDAQHTGSWDSLAEMLMVMHEYLDAKGEGSDSKRLAMQLIQRAINDTWKREKNMAKASRWMRFAFMLCLNHREGDFSLTMLKQAARMAEAAPRNRWELYPESELQWLATTGFNHAIDLLAEGSKPGAIEWMDAALEAARWAQDNGVLHAILTEKRTAASERFELGLGR